MGEDELDDSESTDSLLALVARIPVHTETAWTPPSELDEYRLIQPLGRGGMGSVWLAEDRLLDRLVAVKFIAHAEPDKSTRERFAIEARAAARLQHPNVVSVYRYGELSGRPYLVSEYIRGESLDKLAKPVGWERVLELGLALSRGLAAAHRHGIVHRDIKPANAILTADGDAKLVDFGLARLEHPEARPSDRDLRAAFATGSKPSSDEAGLTAPGAVAGTPRYLAPEVRRGEVADRRADVYGVGCVLYELVIGRAPILDLQDQDTSPVTDGGSRFDRDVPSVADRIGAAGARLAAVIDRCLRHDPELRYGSGEELREALEQLTAPIARGELPEGNPYRGLVPYDAEHRALFFGRTTETRAVIERLRADPFVLVTGDSGAGKSSLVRAGVLPAITDGQLEDGIEHAVIQLVPHHRPLTTLASLLAPIVGLDEAALAVLLRDEPTRLARELRRTRGHQSGLVVFVDQLEELCTISDRDEVAAFGRVLVELATGGPGLRLLATVRSDFLTRDAELPGLGAEISRAIYLLRPLSAEGAREAVIGPAAAKGARFESDELVDTLVAAVTDDRGGLRIELPLLAFTLAQLWDARDPKTQTISTRSLEAIGGVHSALARHADGVLESLLPDQRTGARKLLLRLVTAERTRARRSAGELAGFDRAALDALVRGRLVVARGDDPPTFELAHERLIDGWPTLASWVSDTTEAIAAHGRLTAAVIDWERLGRSKDGLWAARQLADLELLGSEDLTEPETAFARASRGAIRRGRWIRRGIAIAIPAVALGLYVGVRIVASRDLDRRVAGYVATATTSLSEARAESQASAKLRTDAFALFDRSEISRAEPLWDTARQRTTDAQTAYAQATRALEAAFLLDTGRDETRRQLADLTFERAQLAERDYRYAERDELLGRLGLYDPDGELAARRSIPARVTNLVEPAAELEIVTAAGVSIAGKLAHGASTELAPGSYIAVAHAPDRAVVRQSIVVRPGEPIDLAFALPLAGKVPANYVYVPPGSVLYGSREDEFMRHFYEAQPMHERRVDAFLISRTEVTYAQWIEFLDALPKHERARRTPHIQSSPEIPGGELDLRPIDGTWELHFAPGGVGYVARAGAQIEYRDRATRKRQDWLQFPVAGVSSDDADAFATWLDKSGRVPRARLCTEVEWERAGRGADGRSFPHDRPLAPDDANVDVTYDRKDGGMGPDAVGSHPRSNSPFGVADLSGNLWDLVRTADGSVMMRGGAYFINANAAHLANRQAIPPGYRHPHMGLRMCADPS